MFQTLTRDELIGRSDFIFAGWPSPQPAAKPCASEIGRWQVHKVFRGDQSLEGHIISIANHGYKFQEKIISKNGAYQSKGPSYEAFTFKTGQIDRDSSTSILFTQAHKDGCFELAASGAQEHAFAEAEIAALLAGPKDCETSMRGFSLRIDKLPRACMEDSDCDLFYLHPYTCEQPFVLSKSAKNAITNDEFISLQSKARSACQAGSANSPACLNQNKLPVRCNKDKCEAGLPSKSPLPVFRLGKIKSSCAPHDALSVMISTVTSEKNEYPVFTLNWWGENKPRLSNEVGVIYNLNYSGGDAFAAGFSASYCPYKGHCTALKSLVVKVVIDSSGKNSFYEFSFQWMIWKITALN
ncbi:MAG TPA: hypothetical protein PLJ21_05415, partial [Pseudobdellovibrionaceae bacterium]|nr:hypothetical protein [Pseudobdellovibrionaceae bacterium]